MASKPILPRITAGIAGKGGEKVQSVYKTYGISSPVTMSDIRGAIKPAKAMSLSSYEKKLRAKPKK